MVRKTKKNPELCRVEGEGNTDSSPSSDTTTYKYCFTLNNWTREEYDSIMCYLCQDIILYIVGQEVGKKCGTPHLQGYLEFINKCRRVRFLTLKNECEGFKRASFKTARGDALQNYYYCSKEGNFVSNIPIPQELELIKPEEMYNWQSDFLKLISVKKDFKKERNILWIADTETGNGKTELLKYIVNKEKCPFSYGGKMNDIINLIFNNQKYFTTSKNPMMFFNFTRATDTSKVSYSTFESIMDGCISNNKFETGCFLFNRPHIVVFANDYPFVKKMGINRFTVYSIIDKELKHVNLKDIIDINKKKNYSRSLDDDLTTTIESYSN